MNPNKVKCLRRLYAIKDDKQREFNAPVVMANDAVAARTFGDYVNQDAKSPLHLHAGDFSFWYLGSFDIEDGSFDFSEDAHIVCRASDFIKE